jgi:cyclopropane fatty-acyl-phospholipid synthase-like methyltransferase
MDASAKTAIKRRTLSLPVQWLLKKGYIRDVDKVLDYGCGHGFDCDKLGWDGWDLHHRPGDVQKLYDVVVSVYVANVLLDEEIEDFIKGIRARLKHNGTAFIAVRRDIKSEGHTSRGTFQSNRELSLELIKEFKGRFAVYVCYP